MGKDARVKRGWSGYFRLIGIILLVVILSRLELHKLREILSRTNILYLLAAIFLNVPHFFIKALRWQSLLKMQNIDYSLKDSVLAYVGSVYFGFLTPGRLGEIVKAFHLVKDKGVSPARAMPSVIIDRLFDVYLLILLGTAGLWNFGLLGKVSNLAFLGLAVLAGAPLLLLNKRIMDRFVRLAYLILPKVKAMEKLDAYYDDFYNSVRELMTYRLIIGGLLTILANLLFFLQCFCLVRSLGLIDLSYLTVIFMMAITVFITMLPISMAGIGTREAILIFLFSISGLEKEMAVGFSILIFFSFYIIGGLTGLACWLIKPVELKK
jgi:uncharacterized protein (TIRG00374 family)